MQRMDELRDVELPDAGGQPVRLGELWKERPVVMTWLRHYG
jgi:hypothetical protein